MKNELNNVTLNKAELDLVAGGKKKSTQLFISSGACILGPAGPLVSFVLAILGFCEYFQGEENYHYGVSAC